MTKIANTARATGLALIAALTVCSAASASDANPMMLGVKTTAPTGFLQFCSEQPEACSAETPEAIRRAAITSLAAVSLRAEGNAPAAVNVSSGSPLLRVADQNAVETVAPAAGPTTIDWAAAFAEIKAQRELARAEAEAALSAATPVAFSGDAARLIKTVNSKVNRAIIRSADAKTYGRTDVWALPLQSGALAGDCEDYVLEKRKALIEAGVAPQNLSIAVAITQDKQVHAVLLVNTDQGELVLDNLTPWIVRWDETGYTWERRQVAGAAFDWVKVEANAAPLPAAGIQIALNETQLGS